jgi:POT family proton-dependent oligopeptide transporter
VLAVFGAALSQSYGTLLLWARDDARLNLFGRAVPPDFFAALPAVFVLVFGPLLERFTKALTARGRTPSESGKFTAGMMLCAIAYALMLAASLVHRGPAPANPLWLVACNAALALGEILGLPVGLALSESLALPQSKGLTLGLSYGAHALGFWLGGEVSALWPLWTHARFFGALTAGCVLAAALIQSQAGRFARALAVKR